MTIFQVVVVPDWPHVGALSFNFIETPSKKDVLAALDKWAGPPANWNVSDQKMFAAFNRKIEADEYRISQLEVVDNRGEGA